MSLWKYQIEVLPILLFYFHPINEFHVSVLVKIIMMNIPSIDLGAIKY